MGTNLKYRVGGYQVGARPDHAKSHQAGRFGQQQLPHRVDLRKFMTDVEEQVGNSCVANAFVGAYEYLAKREFGESGDISRLFVYYNARARHDSQHEDSGTMMYCAIESLIEHGACCEDLWLNDEAMIFDEPDESAYENAANFTITEAEFIETDLDLWRHTLAEGYPIAFALNLFESFNTATENRGRISLPKRSEDVRETHAWHAMLCVGYSDKDRMFIVRNSWGSDWGDRGYCYIPYDYVMHSDYNGHDSWIIKSVNDLDFTADVWEEDESSFADENSLLLYDFYITTEDPEGFAEALDALCLEYVESEEDYYFDYNYEENDEGTIHLDILNFDLTIEDSTDFLENLEALCQEYAIDEDYSYSFDGESNEESDEESDEEYAEDSEDYEAEYDEESEEYDEESDEEYDENSEEEYE
ncbi:peptidase C1 [Oscillatoria sp. FACHB-1407]|uniref:C1 family peptidase n=1 Tax=Oscillatoria sp. FACHB-1407 TaxID=2692847 RepID=UPI0016857EFA|nr:C1 family peptidase [Oscillatoria sp. FACHB-1407]MBD2463685.1 peptidase C1 [Oscillatoria sp. FACHB-1407]